VHTGGRPQRDKRIGRAVTSDSAEGRENVVPASWSESSVAATAETICEKDENVIETTDDMTNPASIAMLCGQTVYSFGGVDIVVNAPSSIVRKPVAETTDRTWIAS
jgi:NAD(P)-dependent dehydrogenase (short-subunit alcohol dehydrogenase family)